MTTEKKSAAVYYEERPGKPTIVAHGGHGGPTANGTSVAVHLYAESPPIPSIEEFEMNPETGVGQSKQVIQRGEVRREVQATLILTPEAAVSIGAWLVGHGKACLERRGTNE